MIVRRGESDCGAVGRDVRSLHHISSCLTLCRNGYLLQEHVSPPLTLQHTKEKKSVISAWNTNSSTGPMKGYI